MTLPRRESLPAIDIAVSSEIRTFLQKMSKIAEASGDFDVEGCFDALGDTGFHVFTFRYLKPTAYTEIGGQLIARPDVPGRALVEMRASKWHPDPPTRGAYCEAAQTLMRPLLTSYNRINGVRYRLRTERLGIRKPRLSARTEQLFRRFASLANPVALHARDWQRFYEFVRWGRQELSLETIRTLLIDAGFGPNTAERAAEIYEHLWAFKRSKLH